MVDFPIDKSEINKDVQSKAQKKSEFDILKSKYFDERKKTDKTDMANAPVVLKSELEALDKLSEIASAEKKDDDLKWIKERQEYIHNILAETVDTTVSADFSAYINYFGNLTSSKKTDEEGKISEPKKNDAPSKNVASSKNVDMSETLTDFINNFDFENKTQVFDYARRLAVSGISDKTIIAILKVLAGNIDEKDENTFSKTVNTIVAAKKTLTAYRKNEDDERHSVINQLGKQIFMFSDDFYIVMKNNLPIYIKTPESPTPEVAQEEYNEILQKTEDKFMIDFVNKYLKNGEINKNYVRLLSSLRQSGVTYGSLIELIDNCVNKDGTIDKNYLQRIKQLKSAGVLSIDIKMLLDSCKDEDDIKNVCDLTSAIIGGKEVCSLIPDVRGREDVKDFIINASPYFERKENLVNLLNLTKSDGNNVDECALEIAYKLFFNENNTLETEEFSRYLSDTLNIARGNAGYVNDDAAGIVAILAQNNKSYSDIQQGLKICLNKEGNIDEKLAEILWDMSLQNAEISDISDIIDSCKNKSGDINQSKADMIISLFESGNTVEKVKEIFL